MFLFETQMENKSFVLNRFEGDSQFRKTRYIRPRFRICGFADLRIMQKRHTNSVRRCDVCDHTCPLVDSGRLAESCSEHRSNPPNILRLKILIRYRFLIHSFIHDQGEFVPCYDVPSTATIVPLGHGHFALCTRRAKNIPCCQFAVHRS